MSPAAAAGVYWLAQLDQVYDMVPDHIEVYWRPTNGARANCYKVVLTDK
jgi:hypothetical protein